MTRSYPCTYDNKNHIVGITSGAEMKLTQSGGFSIVFYRRR